jgi:DNA polymerase V
MYALVDCNNFYCACERLFNPRLKGRPLIVLSNNDGCAIARSEEAKALGIEMGTPAFLIGDKIRAHGVAVRSSNYALYGDMSDRVMKTLAAFCSRMEIYSIDEAFLDLHHMPWYDLAEWGFRIRDTVNRHTGIPVTIGMGQTKTLAKMANRYAKRRAADTGVFWAVDQKMTGDMLANTAVKDIWGIGRQYAQLLHVNGFTTAADFVNAPPEWVRRHMGVVGQRMQSELKGIPAIGWDDEPGPKKAIATARSFGRQLTLQHEIAEAVGHYAANCAHKLRQQNSCCRRLDVFLQTNVMRPEEPQYARSITVELERASNDTGELIRCALKGLKLIFQPGYAFLKAGVTVRDLVPASSVQGSLFGAVTTSRREARMAAVDALNRRYGRDTIRMAIQGNGRTFKRRAEHLSPRYTTRITDILKIDN